MKKNEKNPPRPTLSPACALIGRFGSRWALLVLLTLHEGGVLRFGELVRAVPSGISERPLFVIWKGPDWSHGGSIPKSRRGWSMRRPRKRSR